MTPEQAAERLANAHPNLMRLMQRLTLTVERAAKQLVPVDTGTLRRSITSQVQENGRRGLVGTNVSYGVFVHEGTRHMRARPFLMQGLDNSRAALDRLIVEAAEEFVEGIAS